MMEKVGLSTTGFTQTDLSPLDNKSARGEPVASTQALGSKQQINLRRIGRTHAGPLPVDNKKP